MKPTTFLPCIFISLLLIIGNECFCQFKYNPKAPVPFDPAFKIGKLENGIRYCVYATDVQKGKAYFYDLFDVGECQENIDEHGTAHFIEHLLAYINENGFEKYSDYLMTIGVDGKLHGAGTGPAGTYYKFGNIPVQRENTLDSILLILKDIPFQLNLNHNVEKQRKIILAEMNMRNDADSGTDENLKMLALKGSKYSANFNSYLDTAIVAHITSGQLKHFHNKWYRPDHLTVIAIGDFNAVKMEEKIKQVFSSIPKAKGISPPIIKYPIPELKEPVVYIDKNPQVESGKIEIHFKQDNALPYNQDRLKGELADQLITYMFQDRLDKKCFESNAVFNEAQFLHDNCLYLSTPKFGEYVITAKATTNSPIIALTDIFTLKGQVNKYGFTKEELQHAKDLLLNSFHLSLKEKSILPCDEYFYMLYYYIVCGTVHPSNQYRYAFAQQVFPEITLTEINNRFRKYLVNTQPAIAITCHQKEGEKVPSVTDVKTIIASLEKQLPPPYTASKTNPELFNKKILPGHVTHQNINKDLGTTEWILSNGMKVIIKTTDFKDNEIQFEGLRNKPLFSIKEEYRSTFLWSTLLLGQMGLDNFTPTQINQLLNGKMLSVETLLLPQLKRIRGDKQGLFGYTDPKEFETCLQLIYLHFKYQRWDKEVLQTKIGLSLNKTQTITPESVLSDTMAYYTSTIRKINADPIRNMSSFTPESLKKVFNTVFGNPANFTFIFTGNIKAEEAKPLIEKYLGSLTPLENQEKESDLIDSTFLKTAERTDEWWKTGSISRKFAYSMRTPVATINICCQGKEENNKNNSLYEKIATKLISDRCNEFIREKKEATYVVGIPEYLSIGKDTTFKLQVNFQTKPEIADQIRKETIDELKRFMAQGPEEKDFNALKRKILESRTEELKSNKWWVDTALYEYYINGKNVTNTYLDEIKNITREDITKFTQGIISQGNLVDVMMLP
ncbi:MAG: insulinase family protein, partial [Bacteroidota bacterium]|nr:insulinase family protein [Bacteroidota bacterium]